MAKKKSPGYWRKRGNSVSMEVCIGTDFKGQPIKYHTSIPYKSDAQAERDLAKFYAECEAGNFKKSEAVTLRAFSDKWMDEYVKVDLKKSTQTSYRSFLDNYILDYFGDRKLTSITPLQVKEWVNYLRVTPGKAGTILSQDYIVNIYSCLDSLFKTAIRWEMVGRNPCATSAPKRPAKKEAGYLSKEQVITMLELLENTPRKDFKFKVAIHVALFSGVRQGELMGLQWDGGVLYEENSISVYQSRMYRPGIGVYIDTPKTVKSVRKIEMPKECMAMLKKLERKQKVDCLKLGREWDNSGFVFVNTFGAPLHPNAIAKWFRDFLRKNNLEQTTFHQLRHTQASLMADLDMKDVDISKRLGHSQITTTNNIYRHLFDKTKTHEAVKSMSDTFYGGISK